MDDKYSLEELKKHLETTIARSKELADEYQDRDFTPGVQQEWDDLIEERKLTEDKIKVREDREKYLATLEGRDDTVEDEKRFTKPSFQTRRASHVPDDPTDLSAYRALSNNMDDLAAAWSDGSKKILERMAPYHPAANREETQGNVERLLDTVDDREKTIARRVITTSSPTYKRAFAKFYMGRGNNATLTPEEQRALGLGAQGGNYPIPIDLDPTVLLTSNGVVNPIRELGTVKQTTKNTYETVASAGVSAGYAAENTEASDDSPTLTQPTWNVERAQCFIPYSTEEDQDWPALLAEMAVLIQDGKDTLEADKFLTGAGHGSQVPQGLLVGGTAVVSTAATATFAVADVYALEEALAPRWRGKPTAAFVMNKKYANKIRQFDTAGGANLWVQLGDGTPSRLLNYTSREWSNYTTASTSNASIVTFGDFSQYWIIDRVGMDISVVPHLFGTANNYPTGQSGLFALWRNTAGVTTQLAFKTLKLL